MHVSRGAEKLIAGLASFPLRLPGAVALDIGASTGGFTEVLLVRARSTCSRSMSGAVNCTRALPTIRASCLEARRARLRAALADQPITAIVSDVSFISLAKALPAALALARSGCWLIALIKPQFEVGPALVGKGGIVRDPAARDEAVKDVSGWMTA